MGSQREVPERLEEAKETILSRWERQVRESIQPARSEERLVLRNSLPLVIDVMVHALRDPTAERGLANEERLAIGHGKHRAQNASYSLEQVVNEYHVLRKVIFDVLEGDGHDLNRRERDLIWDVLFIAIKKAAAEFKGVRDEQARDAARQVDQLYIELQNALGEKSAEARLKEQLLETIRERVEDYAIFTLHADGRVATWGRGAQKMKLYTAADVIGNHYSMLYPEEGVLRDEPDKHLEIARAEGRFRGEGLRRRKNGDFFLADVFITPIWDRDQLVGYFKIVADLTERNRVIQERDLSRTRVESLELDSAQRDRFIYTLSHDLRTPLAAASANCQLIQKYKCEVPQHEGLAGRARRSISRVDEMIRDLLDASRIKAGQPLPLNLEEYDLAQDARIICEDLATVHGDRFVVEGPAPLIGHWDRSGIRRVLENLLTNGIKYGDVTGAVTLRLMPVEDRVFIKVHNQGLSIDPQVQDSLFELFRRAESATRQSEGWGLGLTLVRGITEAHGGIVKLRSLPKEGTTFIVDLPRDSRAPIRTRADAAQHEHEKVQK